MLGHRICKKGRNRLHEIVAARHGHRARPSMATLATSVLLAFLVFLVLCDRSQAAPPIGAGGALDRSFGAGGLVTTNFSWGSGARAQAVLQQGDGKLVVGGGGRNGALGLALARYDADGQLDSTRPASLLAGH